MFVLGNAFIGLLKFLDGLLWVYTFVLLARAIITWVDANPRNTLVRYIKMFTDPVVEGVRRLLPMKLRYFPLDLAFLVLLGMIFVARYAIAAMATQIAANIHP